MSLAQESRDIEVAVCAKRGQIARKLGAKSLVGAMVHVQLGLARIADAAAHAGRFQLRKSRRIVAPGVTSNVAQIALIARIVGRRRLRQR